MDEVERIARGLSKAQRRVLMSGRAPSGAGKWPLQNALIDKGLARYFPFTWTPLGLRLRTHLKGETNG